VAEPTFDCPDLDAFCLIDRMGLTVTGQLVGEDHTVLACRVLEPDDPLERDSWCGRCGVEGAARDTVLRRLAHVPMGWRPTVLDVTIRRYRCAGCGHVWRQDTSSAAAPRSKLSRAAVLWALKSVVIDRLSIARVAEGLGASWHRQRRRPRRRPAAADRGPHSPGRGAGPRGRRALLAPSPGRCRPNRQKPPRSEGAARCMPWRD